MRLRAAAPKMVDDRRYDTSSRREHGRAHGQLEIEAITQRAPMGTAPIHALDALAVALHQSPGREVAGVGQRESLQFFARQEFREGRGAARRFYRSRFRAGRAAGLVGVPRHGRGSSPAARCSRHVWRPAACPLCLAFSLQLCDFYAVRSETVDA